MPCTKFPVIRESLQRNGGRWATSNGRRAKYKMRKNLIKLLTVLPVTLGLLIPVSNLRAQDHDNDDHRYYDREHHDYHHWDAKEDRAWHRYWEERHKRYIDWERANERQREAYWHWRHEHPDAIER
jgi:hypothetical protein